MKKKLLITLLAGALACTSLTACGGADASEDNATVETTEDNKGNNENTSGEASKEEEVNQDGEEQKEAKSLSEIYSLITASVELNQPMIAPDAYIMNAYGIDTTTLDEYVFSLSESSISAETVILIKVGDGTDIDSVKGQLAVWKEYREAELKDYLPEQYDLVADSEIKTKGDYVWVVVSVNSKQILEIIDNNL